MNLRAAPTVPDAASALGQNQMLQASHHILSLLEKSKEHIEDFIDAMPNLFLVMDAEGTIVKGNESLAEVLGQGLEEVLGQSLKGLFKPASWQLFSYHASKVFQGANETAMESAFELPLDATAQAERTFSWTVRPFKATGATATNLLTVFAVDVTKVRGYERQLSHIFSSIPLGIMRLNEKLQILEPYSQFSKVLLEREDLTGVNIFDVLFKPCWDAMTPLGREHAENLKGIVGFASFQYDLVKDSLPRQVTLPSKILPHPRVIGISYEAIVQNDTIEGILVILEDRTEVEHFRLEQEKKNREQEAVVIRFVEVRRLEPHVRQMVGEDLTTFFSKLDDCQSRGDLQQYLRTLHGIKGTARISQFTALKTIAHELETYFLALDASSKQSWLNEHVRLNSIRAEWQEISLLMRMFSGPQVVAKGLDSQRPFTDLIPGLEMVINETAASLKKKAHLSADLGTIMLAPTLIHTIKEVLLHLITNALDHGLETPEERVDCGKAEVGNFTLQATSYSDTLHIQFSDDGRGIDGKRVAASAVKKGHRSQVEIDRMTPEEKINLIFHDGLSTRESATDISGRGIGLDAVKKSLAAIQGQILVESTLGWGTTFSISIKINTDP